MKAKKIVIFLILILCSLTLAGCFGKYPTEADIKITVTNANADIEVLSSDGSVFTKSGNVFTLSDTEVKRYQISVVSKESAAIKFAPQTINITMKDLENGSYEKTVTLKEAEDMFVAEITLAANVPGATVEGLGATWTRTGSKFRTKIAKSEFASLEKSIAISAEGYEARKIAINQANVDAGYYFDTVRLGKSDMSYVDYKLDGNISSDTINVKSLNTGKTYTASVRNESSETGSISTISLEVSKNDLVEIFINSGIKFAKKFVADKTYLDTVDLRANKAQVISTTIVKLKYKLWYENLYLKDEQGYQRIYQGFDMDGYCYINVPNDYAEIVWFKYEHVYDQNDNYQYSGYFEYSFKGALPESLDGIDFRLYNQNGKEVTLFEADRLSLKVKIKDVFNDVYIPFKYSESASVAETVITNQDLTPLDANNDYIYENYSTGEYISFINRYLIAGADNVYTIEVLPNDMEFDVLLNTENFEKIKVLESNNTSNYQNTTAANYNAIKITSEYMIARVSVSDEISDVLNQVREQEIVIWYDLFDQSKTYTKPSRYIAMYSIPVVFDDFNYQSNIEISPENDKMRRGYASYYSEDGMVKAYISMIPGASGVAIGNIYHMSGQRIYEGTLTFNSIDDLVSLGENKYGIYEYGIRVKMVLTQDIDYNKR